ncbi:MAG: hypothetical protein IPJ86_10250 [Bacteroidetes bacterium]|nr:hypothetical protein [Bacteroidota bacterium]
MVQFYVRLAGDLIFYNSPPYSIIVPMGYRLPATGYRLPAASCGLGDLGCILRVAILFENSI